MDLRFSNLSEAEIEPEDKEQMETKIIVKPHPHKWHIAWRNVLGFAYLHYTAALALYQLLNGQVMGYTMVWGLFTLYASALGVTAGAHRLWAHRCYKAKWPMRLILCIFQTLAFQNDLHEWVRDHRVHHKFTDTDADPHNANRGFFFSHIGWLMVRKHPDVKRKGVTVDMSDIEADPIVMFQKRYYLWGIATLTFFLPTLVPCYFWGENKRISWNMCLFRYFVSLNVSWLVNSAAHIWGNKPYDKNLKATENKYVGVLAMGEGWHNYHHVFPWDYKAAELGNYSVNLTTGFIDLCSKIGWAYDLRTVSTDMIHQRAARTGDGGLRAAKDPLHHMNSVWRFGEPDWAQDDRDACLKMKPRIEDENVNTNIEQKLTGKPIVGEDVSPEDHSQVDKKTFRDAMEVMTTLIVLHLIHSQLLV